MRPAGLQHHKVELDLVAARRRFARHGRLFHRADNDGAVFLRRQLARRALPSAPPPAPAEDRTRRLQQQHRTGASIHGFFAVPSEARCQSSRWSNKFGAGLQVWNFHIPSIYRMWCGPEAKYQFRPHFAQGPGGGEGLVQAFIALFPLAQPHPPHPNCRPLVYPPRRLLKRADPAVVYTSIPVYLSPALGSLHAPLSTLQRSAPRASHRSTGPPTPRPPSPDRIASLCRMHSTACCIAIGNDGMVDGLGCGSCMDAALAAAVSDACDRAQHHQEHAAAGSEANG